MILSFLSNSFLSEVLYGGPFMSIELRFYFIIIIISPDKRS